MKFKIGDVVATLFGTQLMTVESNDGLIVRCVWFDDGNLHRRPFMVTALRRARR